MAKRKEVSDNVKTIKVALQEGKAIIGADRVLKTLKQGSLTGVYLAQNCPEELRKNIEHHAALADVPVIVLERDNEELGTLCKKNFFVSVLATA
ncbi:50S ribosomal protein L30 [Candidatus Woesearchaeota archaeon CG10_big_fil_rev_8_21_14_0_10_45_16]|nr:MAG: 50S ribosomal protein L30 [Candidatus Woesearchaeota archaeon CG10_big_fil_rev_8_21_14_0_10_45_16]